MKILVAEDSTFLRVALENALHDWGYTVQSVADGALAWAELQKPDAPRLVILDWIMPGIDGIEVCRNIRQDEPTPPRYIILLTSKREKESIVEGLMAGANDYVTKPFDLDELHARVQVGERVINLQMELAARVRELEEALAQINTLQGLLPICSYCKKIRDDRNYWHRVETYIEKRSDAQFTHSICPECFDKVVSQQITGAGSQP